MATTDRQRALFAAAVALGSELSLDALLQKLVGIPAELTGARYVAIGVIDRSAPRSSASSRTASTRRLIARSASCRMAAAWPAS